MDSTEGLLQLERMRRRYIDKKTKESNMRLTDLIIITYEGNVHLSYIELYKGIIRLRIRPFMEPVRQCYGCFLYGHQKRTCRGIKNILYVKKSSMESAIRNLDV